MNSPAGFRMFKGKQKIAACRAEQVRPGEVVHTPGFLFPKQERLRDAQVMSHSAGWC